jgi:hypothetical protein
MTEEQTVWHELRIKSASASFAFGDRQLNSQKPGGPTVDRESPSGDDRMLISRKNGVKNAIPELAQNGRKRASSYQDSAHAAAVVLSVASLWKPPLLKTRTP